MNAFARCLLAGLTLLVPALPFDGARAGDAGPGPVVFIIDSSGSMAGRDAGGAVKLDAAREQMAGLLSALPVGMPFALIAYGHRRVGDCSDIETLLAAGPHDARDAANRLSALRARGKTPLSESLLAAARLLPPGGGSIVLVSDGIETCHADPCATAATLRASGARITVHVVGFDLAAGEREQLLCIAKAGGGAYWDAADAETLGKALSEVGETVAAGSDDERGSTSALPPPPTPVPTILRAVAGGLGEIVTAPVSWRVVAADGKPVYEGAGRGISLALDPGDYEVTAMASNASGSLRFTVAAGAPEQRVDVPVAAGRLALAVAAHAGADPFSDAEVRGLEWRIEPLDAQPPVAPPAIARPDLLLAPGGYRIRARWNGLAADGDAKVVAGADARLVLDFALGTVTLEAALDGEKDPIAEAGRMRWEIGDGEARREIAGDARPSVTLPAGTYPLRLQLAGLELTDRVVVQPGASATHRLVIAGGTLKLVGALAAGGQPFDDWRDTRWTVSAVDVPGVEEGRAVAESLYELSPAMTLFPGTWRVTLQSGLATQTVDVQVRPGETSEERVDVGAGRIVINVTVAAGAPAPANVVFSLYRVNDGGEVAPEAAFEMGAPEQMRLIVPAGRWVVRASDETGRRGEVALEVAPGGGAEAALPLNR